MSESLNASEIKTLSVEQFFNYFKKSLKKTIAGGRFYFDKVEGFVIHKQPPGSVFVLIFN